MSNGGRKYTDAGGRPVSGTLRMNAAPSTSYPRFQRKRELGKEGQREEGEVKKLDANRRVEDAKLCVVH